MKATEKYYARATDMYGKTIELKVDEDGTLFCGFMNLVALESNATCVYCNNNNLTNLDLPNAIRVRCYNNKLTSLYLPNTKKVHCYNNKLTKLSLPNARIVCCENNELKSIIKDCGNYDRQIWSQRIGETIYVYIVCGRFTLDEAVYSINKKYSGKEAKDYIEKVRLSQKLV